jgi:hypothetical protein
MNLEDIKLGDKSQTQKHKFHLYEIHTAVKLTEMEVVPDPGWGDRESLNGYGVLILQDEKILEIYYITM